MKKIELTEEQRQEKAKLVSKSVKVVCEIALQRGARNDMLDLSEPMAYEVIDLIEYTSDVDLHHCVAKRVLESIGDKLPMEAKKAIRKYFSVY